MPSNYCTDCGKEITQNELKENGGLCEECFDNLVEDVREEMEEE